MVRLRVGAAGVEIALAASSRTKAGLRSDALSEMPILPRGTMPERGKGEQQPTPDELLALSALPLRPRRTCAIGGSASADGGFNDHILENYLIRRQAEERRRKAAARIQRQRENGHSSAGAGTSETHNSHAPVKTRIPSPTSARSNVPSSAAVSANTTPSSVLEGSPLCFLLKPRSAEEHFLRRGDHQGNYYCSESEEDSSYVSSSYVSSPQVSQPTSPTMLRPQGTSDQLHHREGEESGSTARGCESGAEPSDAVVHAGDSGDIFLSGSRASADKHDSLADALLFGDNRRVLSQEYCSSPSASPIFIRSDNYTPTAGELAETRAKFESRRAAAASGKEAQGAAPHTARGPVVSPYALPSRPGTEGGVQGSSASARPSPRAAAKPRNYTESPLQRHAAPEEGVISSEEEMTPIERVEVGDEDVEHQVDVNSVGEVKTPERSGKHFLYQQHTTTAQHIVPPRLACAWCGEGNNSRRSRRSTAPGAVGLQRLQCGHFVCGEHTAEMGLLFAAQGLVCPACGACDRAKWRWK